MTTNHQQPEPLDLGEYERNRVSFPLEELVKYAGKFIAFSGDGKRIVAYGDSEEEVDAMVRSLGIHPSQVVHSYVDPL
jgi:hypothetical protein